MIRKKKYSYSAFFLVFIFLLISLQLLAQNVISDIEMGFKTSRPELIVKHFDPAVRMIILEDTYKPDYDEAIRLLNGFFSENHIVSFEDKFRSEKRQSDFIIKTLKSRESTFRVTIFFKRSETSKKINLLRIETDNGSTF